MTWCKAWHVGWWRDYFQRLAQYGEKDRAVRFEVHLAVNLGGGGRFTERDVAAERLEERTLLTVTFAPLASGSEPARWFADDNGHDDVTGTTNIGDGTDNGVKGDNRLFLPSLQGILSWDASDEVPNPYGGTYFPLQQINYTVVSEIAPIPVTSTFLTVTPGVDANGNAIPRTWQFRTNMSEAVTLATHIQRHTGRTVNFQIQLDAIVSPTGASAATQDISATLLSRDVVAVVEQSSSEEQCGCHQSAPSLTVDDNTSVSNGNGDVTVKPQQSTFVAGPLQSYVLPGNQSDTNPHPVVKIRNLYSSPADTVQIQLLVPGTSTVLASSSLTSTQLGPNALGHFIDVPVQFDASSYSTGVVPFDVRVISTLNGVSTARNLPGQETIIQNNLNSEFGRRMSIAAIDRLVFSGGNKVLMRGSGTSASYVPTGGGGYQRPLGIFTSLSEALVNGSMQYTATSATGERRVFRADGYMTSIFSKEGMETRFTYADLDGNSSDQEMQSATYIPTGATVTHVYSSGRISKSQYDPDGNGPAAAREWSFAFYAGNDNLLQSITGPASGISGEYQPKTVFTYATGSLLVETMEETDTGGTFSQKTKYDYDAYLNIQKITEMGHAGTADDRIWQFTSAESQRLSGSKVAMDTSPVSETIILPDLSTLERTMDAFGNVVSEVQTMPGDTIHTTYKRNMHGQILEQVGPWSNLTPLNVGAMTTKYTYDDGDSTLDSDITDDKLLVRIDYPDQSFESWTYNPASPAADQPTTWRDREGRVTTYTYDANIRLIHTRYTTASLISGIWTLATPTTADIWASQSYDSSGNVVWITSRYRASAISNGLPASIDDSLKTLFPVIDNRGNVRTVQTPDPDGSAGSQTRSEYKYTFDALNRNVAIITPGTQAESFRTTTIAWNNFGEVSTVTSSAPDISGPLTAQTSTAFYDVMGHVTELRKADSIGGISTTLYAFDARNRLLSKSVTLPVNPSGQTVALPRELMTYVYDSSDRVTKSFQPDGTVGGATNTFIETQHVYDDQLRTVAMKQKKNDGTFVTWTQTFDALGRMTRFDTPVPDSSGPNPALSTTYTYLDGNTAYGMIGTLVTMVDPRGITSWTKYGPTGELLVSESADPDGTAAAPVAGTNGSIASYFQTATYNTMGDMTASTDAYGPSFASRTGIRTTNYGRNERGRLTYTMTPDPDGAGPLKSLAVQNAYDNLGQVTLQTNSYVATLNAQGLPASFTNISSTEFQYRSDGLVSAELRRDKNGALDRTISYDYDNLGRTTSTVTPDGTTNYEYDRLGNLAKITYPQVSSPAGNFNPTVEYIYSMTTAGQFLSETKTPWSASTSTGIEDTKYGYDLAGRLIQQFSANPATDTTFSSPTLQWAYDKLGRITSQTDGMGNSLYFGWDNLSRQTSQADGSNLITAVHAQTWKYDAKGDLVQINSPDGRISTMTYDNWARNIDQNRLTDSADPDTIPDMIYSTTRTAWDNYGRKQSVTVGVGNAESQMTSYVYDDIDRVKQRLNAIGGIQNTYFDVRGFVSQVNNEYGQPQYFEYDDYGRLKSTWDYQNSDAKTTYQYDTMDHLDSVTTPLKKVGSTVTYATTSYIQDALGRVTSQTDSLNGTTLYAYDRAGNLASLTDPQNNQTRWEYDRRNRLQFEKITIPINGTNTEVTRQNIYDNADNLTWTKDRNDRWREFSYSFAFGANGNYRLNQESWWLSGVYSNRIQYAYSEGNGLRMTSITDQNAVTNPTAVYSKVEFSYDDRGRLTLLRDRIDPTTTPSTSESFDLNYTYNTVDQRTNTATRFRQYHSSGQATTFQWGAALSYAWDKLNRVTSVQQLSAVNPADATWVLDHTKSKTVQLQYYANGALKKLTRTQGTSTSASSTLVTDYVQQNPEWWYAGEVAAIVHSGFDGGAAQNRSIEYDFDVARRVTDTREKLGTSVIDARSYAYDSTSQVTGVTSTGGSGETYGYDSNGNRTATTTGSGSASYATGAFNRVTDDGTYTYQYDKEGNRTRRENKVRPPSNDTTTIWFEIYTWDFRNRLTIVTKYNRAGTWQEYVTYEYDGLDQRIRKTVNVRSQSPPTVQERYIYDRNVTDPSMSEVLLVINELSSASSTWQKVSHRFMNGPQIDQVFSDETNGGILWYLQDRQNTVRDVATWDGHGDATKEWKDVNHISYDTFGNVIGVDDPTTTGADTNGIPGTDTLNAPRRSYTGREPDSATGLIYYRARWFDPQLGRFISEDPIGFAAGDANLSRYVGNSTPNAVDPSGMDGRSVDDVNRRIRNRLKQIDPAVARFILEHDLQVIDRKGFNWSLKSFDVTSCKEGFLTGIEVSSGTTEFERLRYLRAFVRRNRQFQQWESGNYYYHDPGSISPSPGTADYERMMRRLREEEMELMYAMGATYDEVIKVQNDRIAFEWLGPGGNLETVIHSLAPVAITVNASRQNQGGSCRYPIPRSDDPTFATGSVGAARAWTTKARYAATGLPNSGRIRYVPEENYNPKVPFPRGPQNGYLDRFGNEWRWDPVKSEWDVQLSRTGKSQLGWLSNSGDHVNISPAGEVTH